jgi:thymidylate synthase
VIVIQGNNNVDVMLRMYRAVVAGYEFEPRGEKCRNVQNLAVILHPGPIITSFFHRKMNLAYAKREWLWYLGADAKDDSICEHAQLWKKLKQPDGTFFSNYGQYLFAKPEGGSSQFEYVIRCLKADPSSRRASMMLLSKDHLFMENIDTVCTYAINFTISNGCLDMTVMMRSNDVVYGFTNDAFCFSQLHAFVFKVLQFSMPGLKMGFYTHFTNSMHVYEKHYEMLRNIIGNPGYKPMVPPQVEAKEALELVLTRGQGGSGEYTKWLKTFD